MTRQREILDLIEPDALSDDVPAVVLECLHVFEPRERLVELQRAVAPYYLPGGIHVVLDQFRHSGEAWLKCALPARKQRTKAVPAHIEGDVDVFETSVIAQAEAEEVALVGAVPHQKGAILG